MRTGGYLSGNDRILTKRDSRQDDSFASGRGADLRGTKWLLLSRPRPTEDLMGTMINPFPHDPDCSAIWTMLVERAVDAFLARDWPMVQHNFIAQAFFARPSLFKPPPAHSIMSFPD